MSSDITPIRRQYLEVKKQYPNVIVFFRMGDFYETFDDDASITSKELDIVLTSRNVSKGIRIPMAGIPFHALDNYLARLIDKGYHVAICDQVGEQPKKGLVPRKVVRVVTPGTLIEPELLSGERNNYLASVMIQKQASSLAFVDISTGEFRVTEIHAENAEEIIKDELQRLKPAETLYPENAEFRQILLGHFTSLPKWKFELRNCLDTLRTHFKVGTLDGFGLRDKSLAIQACGAIIQYLQDTQPTSLQILNSVSTYSTSEFMTLDAATLRNLEITETIRGSGIKGSLLSVLDRTITSMGQRLMRQWLSQPLLDISIINQRQECIDYLISHGLQRAELREIFHRIGDLERLCTRVVSGTATPRDLLAIRNIFDYLPKVNECISDSSLSLAGILSGVHLFERELSLLQSSLNEDAPSHLQKSGVIRSGYSVELDQVIEASRHARDWISNLESSERVRTSIKNLKVGFNKVFGYYIEVTHSNVESIPPDYIRKQTLVNAERYITPELKEYESLVLNAEENIHEIELRVFHQVCEQLAASGSQMMETARMLAQLDVLSALAETAVLNQYKKPDVSVGGGLNICDSRHPVVEQNLNEQRFVPNDVILEDGEILRIITGPNMSGKSTYLRQIALIVLMAQIGSYVPASSARIGLVDRIFTRIGAQDEIHAGQSTFMVEMVETANILNHATPKSLIILDEIGRGTSTYDGVSIAWAVVEYLHNHPRIHARTFFATHYHELMQLSQILPGVRNYNVAVVESEGKVVFLHKIVSGGSDRSYGIHVGELAGLPQPVVRRASEILRQLEASSGRATNLDSQLAMQMNLFPETNPLIDELRKIDMDTISPIQAINILYEWKRRFIDRQGE